MQLVCKREIRHRAPIQRRLELVEENEVMEAMAREQEMHVE